MADNSISRRIRRRLSDLQILSFPAIRIFGRIWCFSMHHFGSADRRGPLFDYIRNERPCIIAYWHQDSVPLLFELIRYTRGYPSSARVSRGRMGDFVINLLAPWHVRFARGSNSTGGRQAIDQLETDATQERRSLFITVDGSSGPARKAQWGAIRLAQKTGLPIIPVRAWGTNLSVLENTWMKLAIPRPGGRSVFLSDRPLWVSPRASPDELDALRLDLEQRLNDLAEASWAYFDETTSLADRYGEPSPSLREAERRRVKEAAAPPVAIAPGA